MNVPTRSSPLTPSCLSPPASRATRSPTVLYDARRAVSPCQVTTSASPHMVVPYCMIRVTESGTSCMVLRTALILTYVGSVGEAAEEQLDELVDELAPGDRLTVEPPVAGLADHADDPVRPD